MDLSRPTDAPLIRAIQRGFPLVPRPYAALARQLGMTEDQVLAALARLQENGTIKRLGVIVRHRALGYGANAMVVWQLPEDRISEVGRRIGRLPFVTLSYRRPPRPPHWPYTLFTMIHGRDRSSVLAQVEAIKRQCGLETVECAVLFSGRCFKQRGAWYDSALTERRESSPTNGEIEARICKER